MISPPTDSLRPKFGTAIRMSQGGEFGRVFKKKMVEPRGIEPRSWDGILKASTSLADQGF